MKWIRLKYIYHKTINYLGETSIYGGSGAVCRSVSGVMLLALITNGFNILNAEPFYKDLTTGVVIVATVALTSGRK